MKAGKLIVTGLDLETTGLHVHKGDRIVEICLDVYELTDSWRAVRTIQSYINPLRAIHPDAQAVHKIAYEDVKDAPTWEDYGPTVAKVLAVTDVLIIHNASFDEPFIRAELERIGLPLRADIKVFCTMENARWATYDGKNPSLLELCWSLGIDYDASVAHKADYDTGLMMRCYQKGIDLNLYENPKE